MLDDWVVEDSDEGPVALLSPVWIGCVEAVESDDCWATMSVRLEGASSSEGWTGILMAVSVT